MSFMSKIKKPLALGLTIGGGVLTVTGATLLGVGCNYTYTMESKMSADNAYSQTIGVGSQNYMKLISGYQTINGKKTDIPQSEIDEYNKKITGPNSERPKSYNDYLDQNKKQKEEVQKSIDTIKNQINQLPAGTPEELKTAMNKSLEAAEKSLDVYKAIDTGYAMMVSGAVLFSIFTLVTAFGIFAIIKGGKN